MKLKVLAIAATLLVASSAQAVPMLIAGWDFSQWQQPGVLTTDGASLQDTLAANYSDLDPNGLGAQSTARGTMFLNGQKGSFATPLDLSDPFRPQTPSIPRNENAAQVPMGSAAAGNILLNEGPQTSFNDFKMLAGGTGVINVVFGAFAGVLGSDFEVSFGGVTLTGTSNVAVAFSSNDGTTYTPITSVQLTNAFQQFIVPLGGSNLGNVFVRLSFTGSETIGPAIDNLAIKANLAAVVPEPSLALLGLTGALGLALRRRRS